MPGQNGMETARKLRKKDKNIIIIFVTGMEEYVFQAFDVGAFHYLVKPLEDEKFKDILCRAVESLGSKEMDLQKSEERYVMINNGGVHRKVIIEEIVYAEVFNRKVVIHKLNGDIEYYGKMSHLEAVAGDNFSDPTEPIL